MHIQPIRNTADHQRALAELTACLENDPVPGSEAADDAEVLATLIEHYEDAHFATELPSPVEAIRFRMDQLDMAQKDLAAYIGSESKVSEVLSGKRPLSMAMIRRLHSGLGIPADVLIGESKPASQARVSAKRLARLGGTDPDAKAAPRRRSTPA